eukprot:gene4495-6351_t
MSSNIVEFEHFIGLNSFYNGTIFHPNNQKYIYSSGGNVIIGDLLDNHSQNFLKHGHNDYITSLVLSRSGKYIGSGQKGDQSNVIIWDYDSQSIIYCFEEHDHMIQSLAFSDDEKIFASLGNEMDDKLIIWDLSNGYIIASASKLPIGTKTIQFGGFIKDIKRRNTENYLLCSAGQDGLVVWDLNPYNGDLLPMKILGETRASITRQLTSVCFSDDFEFIYCATTSGDFVIASMKAKKMVGNIQATKMSLNCILYHPRGIVIGCGDRSVKLYSVQGDLLGQVQLDGAVIGLSFSPDRVEVLATTSFGTIYRLNLNTFQFIIISESHTQSVIKMAFDQGGNSNERFATSATDGTIKVWDLAEYMVISTAFPRKDQARGVLATSLAFSDIIISGWTDGKVLAFSAETGENLWVLDNAHQGGVSALTLSNNRRFILTGGPQGEVRLWELRSRDLISHLKEHKQIVNAIAVFDDDTKAVSASRDRCLLRWDLKNELRVHCHMQRMGGIYDLIISRDQTHIISVGQEKRITLWNNRTNDIVYQRLIDDENDEAKSITMSRDGKWIATGGSAGIVRLWEFQLNESPPLKLISESSGHSRGISSLSFSNDDKQIVSVGDDGAIFIWCFYG